MTQLKVALIGCGGMGLQHATRLASLNSIVKLVAFSDIYLSRALAFSAQFGGTPYSDWRNMLSKEAIDALYVCNPAYARKDEIERAAEKHIHVFVEKPISLNLGQANKIAHAVFQNGVKSQVGYMTRHTLAAEKSREIVMNGEVGKPKLAIFRLWNYWNPRFRTGWRNSLKKSGGPLMEQGSHVIDLMRYVLGEIDSVGGATGQMSQEIRSDDATEDFLGMTMRFLSGAIGTMSMTVTAPLPWDKPINDWSLATEKALVTAPNPHTIVVQDSTGHESFRQEEKRDPYLFESKDFLEAIVSDSVTKTPVAEGVKTLEAVLMARRALGTALTA